MPTVYIPNKGTHDYSDAERFGDLVFIADGFIDRYNFSLMVNFINDKTKNSTPEDYLMISGLNSFSAIAAAILAAKHGRLNLLVHRFDSYDSATILVEEK